MKFNRERWRTLAENKPDELHSYIPQSSISELFDEIDRLTAELAELRERTRWIPRKEKMPEVDKRVEFFGGFEQTTYIGYYREHATQWESESGGFWHEKNFGFITHWRNLPEPPEATDD